MYLFGHSMIIIGSYQSLIYFTSRRHTCTSLVAWCNWVTWCSL